MGGSDVPKNEIVRKRMGKIEVFKPFAKLSPQRDSTNLYNQQPGI
jgi:hypothetical protein